MLLSSASESPGSMNSLLCVGWIPPTMQGLSPSNPYTMPKDLEKTVSSLISMYPGVPSTVSRQSMLRAIASTSCCPDAQKKFGRPGSSKETGLLTARREMPNARWISGFFRPRIELKVGDGKSTPISKLNWTMATCEKTKKTYTIKSKKIQWNQFTKMQQYAKHQNWEALTQEESQFLQRGNNGTWWGMKDLETHGETIKNIEKRMENIYIYNTSHLHGISWNFNEMKNIEKQCEPAQRFWKWFLGAWTSMQLEKSNRTLKGLKDIKLNMFTLWGLSKILKMFSRGGN